jgi:single-strand DNA-binding protein
MAHTIVIKLNKAANEFQAGESIGFNVRGGVQYYDRKTKQKEWTNYSAVIFAKAPAQIDFYRSALIEGSKVELSGKTQKIDVYEGGQNGPNYTIEFQDAWLGDISTPMQQQPQQGQSMHQPQQQHNQPMAQPQGGFAPQQQHPQNAAYTQPQGHPQQGVHQSGFPQSQPQGGTQQPNFNHPQR